MLKIQTDKFHVKKIHPLIIGHFHLKI